MLRLLAETVERLRKRMSGQLKAGKEKKQTPVRPPKRRRKARRGRSR